MSVSLIHFLTVSYLYTGHNCVLTIICTNYDLYAVSNLLTYYYYHISYCTVNMYYYAP